MSLPPLSRADFVEYFQAVNDGHNPFPWQSRVARRVVGTREAPGDWPQALALPTASGKTAAIDIAVFALACQADWPVEWRTAPRRIFFVVDRRVIVDEAFERAKILAERLRSADDGILKTIADRLGRLSGDGDPLACFQLRGGIYRNDAWARTPTQPTVIASTVDQIGSRLLYRGYGLRSGSLWPVHAGLAANDSLILLDEAHCSNPFRQTLAAIGRYRSWREAGDAYEAFSTPFHVVLMSATPAADLTDVEALRDDDQTHSVLNKRLNAAKPTRLVVATQAKGIRALDQLAKELVRQAKATLTADKHVYAVAILVNRVATARLVHAALDGVKEHDAVLLTGRMRSLDRQDVVDYWLKRLNAAGAAQRQLERPVFVVATQCLEVGANLDFDAMVSECASLDALRQRFGRLNRMGRPVNATGVIVVRADQTERKEKDPDPIYGDALPDTWAWLQEHAGRLEQNDGQGPVINMGISAMEMMLPKQPSQRSAVLKGLQPPAPDAPVMLPAHLDCWVQTSPEPRPSPDVSVFLHGPQRGVAEIQVCWRADLESAETEAEEHWIDALTLCPPASAECISVPLPLFRRWMSGNSDDGALLADVEGGAIEEESEPASPTTARMVVCWQGAERSRVVTDPQDIRPGETVVIPAALEGWEVFGHMPATAQVDLGDRVQLVARARPVLRLHRRLVTSWPSSSGAQGLLDLVDRSELPEDPSEVRGQLAFLAQATDLPPSFDWLREAAGHLSRDNRLRILKHPCGGLVLRASRAIYGSRGACGTFSDEDQSSSATVSVELPAHVCGVARRVCEFAKACGLPEPLVEDLALAARLHDLGKVDPRFQTWLFGGNRRAAKAAKEPLAKSERLARSRREQAITRERSGYPKGGRHELLSVRLVESVHEFLDHAHDRDLVLHLIASHHGYCRPFAPVVEEPEPVTVTHTFDGHPCTASSATGLEQLDSGVAERFWRLVRRYGWWGIAWLEAMLRLADHRQSEWEERQAEEAER